MTLTETDARFLHIAQLADAAFNSRRPDEMAAALEAIREDARACLPVGMTYADMIEETALRR